MLTYVENWKGKRDLKRKALKLWKLKTNTTFQNLSKSISSRGWFCCYLIKLSLFKVNKHKWNIIFKLSLRDFHIVKLFNISSTPNFHYCTEYINPKKGFLTRRKTKASWKFSIFCNFSTNNTQKGIYPIRFTVCFEQRLSFLML